MMGGGRDGRLTPPIIEMDTLQSMLRKKIDGKKYLLVRDDVWNESYEKWVHLKRLLMGGANGSRILITTSSKQVAETFDVLSLYSLGNLNGDASWLLFTKMAFLKEAEEELENSNLVKIGKEIVVKLNGVPLAIRTIGGLLSFKKNQKLNGYLSRTTNFQELCNKKMRCNQYLRSATITSHLI